MFWVNVNVANVLGIQSHRSLAQQVVCALQEGQLEGCGWTLDMLPVRYR